mmetsp:Transcript_22861/g.68635  ORF Transcript_22861/g.68635 Transcript_22861/m.68635 type:complete len:121 (+) Transcript_22861:71-433(+)
MLAARTALRARTHARATSRGLATSSILPRPRTVIFGAGALGAAGYWAYFRANEKLHHSEIQWHGADRGALPPTSQIFVRNEEDPHGVAPELRRVWRVTSEDGFNREGDDKISAEGQQATV